MVLLEIAGWALAIATAGATFFTVVTYAAASRFQTRRPFARTLVEFLREIAWSVLLVFLIPVLYLAGRRLGRGGTGKVPVVFVHGYTQNRSNFLRMAGIVGRGAVGPLYGFNYPWMLRVEPCAKSLSRFVERVCSETGAERVDLVCHSLGGLVARTMLAQGGAARVRRVVTIGSPHAGVTWRLPLLGGCGPQMKRGSPFLTGLAAPLPVPFLSLYSTHDNIVHPVEASSLAALGGRDQVVEEGYGHLSLLFSPKVAEQVRAFLEEP